MINEGFDHTAVMNALTQSHDLSQYLKTNPHPHITCLCIKGSFRNSCDDIDKYFDDEDHAEMLQDTADKIRDRYGTPQIDDSHTNFPIPSQTENGQFFPSSASTSNAEVDHPSAEEVDKKFVEFFESKEQNYSKTVLFESTMNFILDTLQPISEKDIDDTYEDMFLCGSEYLGRIINDTHLTSLSFNNTDMTNDWLLNFAKHLPGSHITSLVLPRIFDDYRTRIVEDQKEYSSSADSSCDNIKCKTLDNFESLRKKPRLTPVDASCNEKAQKNGLQYLASILKYTEISSLDFGGNPINLKMLSCSLIESKITCLSLRACKLKNDGLNCLARILKYTQITSMDLSQNELDCESLKIFVAGLEGTNITSLNLSTNRIGIDGMNCLGRFLKKTSIVSLDISNNNLNYESLKVFLNCIVDSKITSLFLKNNDIGIDGLICLGSVLKNTQITSLDISEIEFNLEQMKVFAPCLVDTKITFLGLQCNSIDIEELDILSNVIKNTGITSIDLHDNLWGSDDRNPDEILINLISLDRLLKSQLTSINIGNSDHFDSFASSLVGSNITYLGLKEQTLGMNELESLGNILKNSNITTIDISYNELDNESFKMFVPFLVDSKITSLDLSGNCLYYDGINELGSVLKNTQITSLNLSNCFMKCNDIKNFVMYLPDTKITSLNLSGNVICCNFFYLAFILKHTQITTLNLGSQKNNEYDVDPLYFIQLFNSIDTSLHLFNRNICLFSWYFLALNLRNTKIDSLKVTGGEIDCDGLKYLTRGLLNSQVVELDLRKNNINCSGAYYLAEVLKHTRISSLKLAENKISCKGLKYLTEGLGGSQIKSLNLFRNYINNEGIQGLVESLVGTQLVKLDLRGNMIGSDAAYHLSEIVRQSKLKSMFIRIDFRDDVSASFSLCKYDNCFIEINESLASEEGIVNVIKKDYQKNGITLLLLIGDEFSHLAGAFNDMNINQAVYITHYSSYNEDELNLELTSCLANCSIGELEIKGYQLSTNSFEQIDVKALKILPDPISDTNYYADNLRLSLIKSSIVYLDLSNNKIGDFEFEDLVDILLGSQIISLNLSCNELTNRCVKLLARVLPDTKLTYIDLHRNRIGFRGFKYLMNVVDNTKLCWLSLENNNIEKDLEEDIELSPYIVPRIDNPIEFQIRYLFKELVSLNTATEQFEFVIPREDSIITINHYPRLVKHLLDTPIYKMHIYDYLYMQSKRHEIHLLNTINVFIEKIKTNFFSFFESRVMQFEERFGYDIFLSLVKECDSLNLTDFVEFLLLHRVLYYVDDEQNFLHPFIYKMLLKHQMPLYIEDIEPNKKQLIIYYFEKHSDIDGAREIIDLLK